MGIDLFWRSSRSAFVCQVAVIGSVLSALALSTGWAGESEDLSSQIKIEGYLYEKGTRIPLSDISVFLMPAKLKAQTNSVGYFKIDGVPEGKFTWIVNASGYLRLEEEDEQTHQQPNEVRELYLERNSYQVYETTIYGKEEKRDDVSRSLSRKEFLKVPGARGDPVKAVENLPGVARTNAFQAQVIIQGSAPQDTRYSIDGQEVPIIFHFGGLTSVLMPESIEAVDYLAAGYGPEFGRALGGQVAVTTRNPKQNRFQGFAFVDTFNAGGLLEAPLSSKSRLLVSARQSYIGSVLKAVLKDSSSFNLTVAPEFRDTTIIFESELTHRDTLKVVAIGSQDSLEFLFSQPLKTDPSLRGTFSNQTAFFRLIPELTHCHSDITTSRFRFGVGRDWIKVNVGSSFFNLQTYGLSTRYDLDRKMSSVWSASWGMDHLFTWAKVNLDLPTFYNAGGVLNPISSSVQRRADVSRSYQNFGVYWRNVFHHQDSSWSYLPSLRMEHYSSTKETLVLPRAALRYSVDDTLGFRLAGGLYGQPPQPQEIDDTVGNPDLKANRGVHFSLLMDKDFRGGFSDGFELSTGPFYKYLYDLVIPSSSLVVRGGTLAPENFKNAQTGKVMGGQVLLKYAFSPWSGWLSYTVSRSTRSDSQGSDYLFNYDQTHVLTLLTSVDLSSNWTLSGRFRYSSGNPYTPILGGALDTDNDVYVPLRGAFYSERLEPFYQFDLRIDKKWVFKTWMLSLYVDIQNVTNHQNIQQIQYSYNYESNSRVAGLPFLPTFGLKGEF